MANEITFDKLPQAVGYLTEQVERIHKIVAALQPMQPQTEVVEVEPAELLALSVGNGQASSEEDVLAGKRRSTWATYGSSTL